MHRVDCGFAAFSGHRVECHANPVQGLSQLGLQEETGVSELNSTAASLNERHPNTFLQELDLLTDGAGRHAQLHRSFGNTKVTSRSLEGT